MGEGMGEGRGGGRACPGVVLGITTRVMSGIAQTAIKICNDPEVQTNTTPKYKNIQH
jgi:hypothetical protein